MKENENMALKNSPEKVFQMSKEYKLCKKKALFTNTEIRIMHFQSPAHVRLSPAHV